MPVLLRIDSSAGGVQSRTRMLTTAFADAWAARGPGYEVVGRDLHADQPPHLRTPAQHWPERMRGGETLDPATEALQARLLEELLAADAVLIGAPMYNFSMPSTLKAWLDFVHVPGVTSPLEEQTLPLRGRPAVIATSRGMASDSVSDALLTAPLEYVLGEVFGMRTEVVSTSRSLADTIPEFDLELASAELEQALSRARVLGAAI